MERNYPRCLVSHLRQAVSNIFQFFDPNERIWNRFKFYSAGIIHRSEKRYRSIAGQIYI